jgi:hypothetical protein
MKGWVAELVDVCESKRSTSRNQREPKIATPQIREGTPLTMRPLLSNALGGARSGRYSMQVQILPQPQ